MKNINSVIVSGRITRDPEIRRTQSGMAVMQLGVAVNDSKKNQQGEWEEYPNYIDCVMLGDRAEKMANMLGKGMKVCISGKLRYSSWEKDGQRRSKVEVMIDQIEFMSRKDKQEKPPEPFAMDEYIPF